MVSSETVVAGAAVGLLGAEAKGVTDLTGGGDDDGEQGGGGGNAAPGLSGLFGELSSIRADVANARAAVGQTPDFSELASAFSGGVQRSVSDSIGQGVLGPNLQANQYDPIRELLNADSPTDTQTAGNTTNDTALYDRLLGDPIQTGARAGGETVGRTPFSVAGGIADGFIGGLNDAVSNARERGRENNQGYYRFSDDGDSLAQDLISGDTNNPVDDWYNEQMSNAGLDNLRSDTPLLGGNGGGSSSDGSSSGNGESSSDGSSGGGLSSASDLQSAISGDSSSGDSVSSSDTNGGDSGDSSSQAGRGTSLGSASSASGGNSTSQAGRGTSLGSASSGGGDSVSPSDTNGGDSGGDSGGGIGSTIASGLKSASETLI